MVRGTNRQALAYFGHSLVNRMVSINDFVMCNKRV